jgi:2,4-dienoyl-CoA reductase-like NADH-dependent reductase (Old Yellow Enzyme family)
MIPELTPIWGYKAIPCQSINYLPIIPLMTNNINSALEVNPFSPYKIGKLQLSNRFMRSATFDGTADETGAVTDASVDIFRRLGTSGIGLIVTGHAFITEAGQAGPGQYGIHKDEMIPGLSKLVKVVHGEGGKIAVQIAHAGINSSYLEEKGETAWAVSANPEAARPHREMTDEDIENTIEAFNAAARRALEAGFDAVQIHGAHGYLISQFLSPITNTRNDGWGGSVEKRCQFLIEVIKRIRKTLNEKIPLLIKYGVKDDIEGGVTIEEGIETARLLAANGVAAIEVSGGIGQNSVVKGNAYFRDRAAAVKRAVSIPVAEVGGIRDLETVYSILNYGDADIISMSRPFIREPEILLRWQKANEAISDCISCNRCMINTRRKKCLQCVQINRNGKADKKKK